MFAFAITLLLTSPKVASNDILARNIDHSVKPGTDFFQYANGTFFKRNPIPAAETSWGIGNLVRDELYTRLKAVNTQAIKSHAKVGSDNQKLADFWTTALDQSKADRLGIKPLKAELDKIDKISNIREVLAESFRLHEFGTGTFFDLRVSQDEKQSDVMSFEVSQGGLGMPDREYYLSTEAGTVKVRNAYSKYIKDMLNLDNSKSGATSAQGVLNIEITLAKASRKLADLRDAEHNYNKMSLHDAEEKLAPSIHWADELAKWNLHPTDVVVGQPEFFTALEPLLASTPIEHLKAYLRFHLVSDYAPYLSKKADDLNFDFYNRTMNGQKVQQPRWKRALEAENMSIGNILGRSFVKEYFPPAAKKRYSDLIDTFKAVYHNRIDLYDWMSPETKKKAHEKLTSMVKKVGYPDKWKDYSALKIGKNSFCENMMNASTWVFRDNISKFGKPVDRSEWGMTPQTFNAYYDPSNNEIVMPAAAFVIPGMKESEIDEALMYGNAGASWIGHEMTHGFDDEGRHFDSKGNLADWWTKEDSEQFDKRAQVMVEQFNVYEPLPGIHINGKATLGENIADYGGLLLGIDAFKLSKAYKANKKIGGLTPMQRFFLGYDLSWLGEQTSQSLRRGLLSDVHSPAKYRVNGPLSNLPDFYEAFGIKQGDPMWRPADKRPNIW